MKSTCDVGVVHNGVSARSLEDGRAQALPQDAASYAVARDAGGGGVGQRANDMTNMTTRRPFRLERFDVSTQVSSPCVRSVQGGQWGRMAAVEQASGEI
eukprot:2719326-Pyramimonas_sp.AAC.1